MPERFSDQMAAAARRAVELSQSRAQAILDFSEASLETVEAMLEEMSHIRLSDAQIEAISQDFGSYILEVARRNHGGEYFWVEERNEPVLVWGQPRFHIALVGWTKALGRLKGDVGDNIPFFYAGFAERLKDPPLGREITFV